MKIENTLKFAALLAAGAAFVCGQTQVDFENAIENRRFFTGTGDPAGQNRNGFTGNMQCRRSVFSDDRGAGRESICVHFSQYMVAAERVRGRGRW